MSSGTKREMIQIRFFLPEPANTSYNRMYPDQRLRILAITRDWSMYWMAELVNKEKVRREKMPYGKRKRRS